MLVEGKILVVVFASKLQMSASHWLVGSIVCGWGIFESNFCLNKFVMYQRLICNQRVYTRRKVCKKAEKCHGIY